MRWLPVILLLASIPAQAQTPGAPPVLQIPSPGPSTSNLMGGQPAILVTGSTSGAVVPQTGCILVDVGSCLLADVGVKLLVQ